MTRIVALLLVRDEDRFIDRTLANLEGFCDRLIVADNGSVDGTPDVLARWRERCPKLEVHAITDPVRSHALVAGLAGTDTWVFGVDGDELYDPAGLSRLRERLLAGEFADVWRVVGHTVHCDRLDPERYVAEGFPGPPSRTATKLYNFARIVSWEGCPQRLHGGSLVFRPGASEQQQCRLFETADWEHSDLRCLHMAFVRRSSRQDARLAARPNVTETWGGGWKGRLARLVRRLSGAPPQSGYKQASYRLGERVTVDVRPFFGDGCGGGA